MRDFTAPHMRPQQSRSASPKARRNLFARVFGIGYQAEAGVLHPVRQKPAGRRVRPNGGLELLAAILVAVVFTACGAVYYCSELLNVQDGIFYHNVTVDNVDVGGKTKEEALALFAGDRSVPKLGVTVEIDGRKWDIRSADVDARYNLDEVMAQALAVGHEGGVLKRLAEILKLRNEAANFPLSATYNESKLHEIAVEITRETSLAPTNAALQFFPASDPCFVYSEEKPGRDVDAEELYTQMKASMDTGTIAVLSMQSKVLQPHETMQQLKDRTQMIGTFTTALKPNVVRTGNVLLAGDAVNGTVLEPGEEFSFNQTTGERTKARGYGDAPTISGGQLVDAPGGGVCQVSTTIYNAALLAGLEIVERHNHTWPLTYAEAGRDATVDWGSKKDLRIRNSTDKPVYLLFSVDTAKALVTAEFYGLPGIESITVVAEGLETITPPKPLKYSNASKPIGWTKTITPARNGCRVKIYRIFTNGEEVHRELVSEDYYPPQRGEIEIGTQAPPGNDDNK